jgi:hypothetical protein
MKVVCTLTREQATLYKAVVDEEMRRIEVADGIERRGRVLALLMFTKQICNHPAQFLSESGPLPKRSGKLARVTEMLEEAIAEGDRALVFTQFRGMVPFSDTDDHLGQLQDGHPRVLRGVVHEPSSCRHVQNGQSLRTTDRPRLASSRRR